MLPHSTDHQRTTIVCRPAAIAIHSVFTAVLALCLLFLSPAPLHAEDFGLLDQHGKFHQLSRYSNDNLVLIMPVSMNDPDSLVNAHAMQSLAHETVSYTHLTLPTNREV